MTDAGWRKYFPLVFVAIVSSLATATIFLAVERMERGTVRSGVDGQAAPAPVATVIKPGSDAFVAARKLVEPAVVYIDVQTVRQAPRWSGDDFFPFLEPFREFFGPQIRQGTGSGFIFRADGYILTNAHVVDGAQKLQVTLADKRKFSGKVLGIDRQLDLAVVKIDADGLPTVTFGDSDKLEAGEWVLAIGNPFGYHHTVTAGIVSALNRSLENPDANGYLIQTDAAINPGNSGGPLIDLQGRVVGINEAIRADAQGMGFAIPINMARERLDDLSSGKIPAEQKQPWLGIVMGDLADLSPAVRQQYGIVMQKGVYVVEVATGSPAEKAGLQRLDVITSINREEVTTMEQIRERVTRAKIGETLTIVANRRGQYLSFQAKLEAKPADQP